MVMIPVAMTTLLSKLPNSNNDLDGCFFVSNTSETASHRKKSNSFSSSGSSNPEASCTNSCSSGPDVCRHCLVETGKYCWEIFTINSYSYINLLLSCSSSSSDSSSFSSVGICSRLVGHNLHPGLEGFVYTLLFASGFCHRISGRKIDCVFSHKHCCYPPHYIYKFSEPLAAF